MHVLECREVQVERPSWTHQIRRHVAVVQVQSVTRMVEGSTHVLLVSFFVVLEMFFLFKITLFLKTRKRTMERNELHEDGGCRD
jgi:hypothetical protein